MGDGMDDPAGLTLDGAGNVYVAGKASNNLLRLEGQLCQLDLGFGGPGETRLMVCGEALAAGGAAPRAGAGARAASNSTSSSREQWPRCNTARIRTTIGRPRNRSLR